MKTLLLLLIITLTSYYVAAEHLLVGDISHAELASSEAVQYNAIPFKKRVKYYFYTQPDNRKIRGIQAIDNLHSKASMNITAGGVGQAFVNLRMKSERGSGLDYNIGIYVEPFNRF
ncbi:uncharacterized protein LOC114350438 isoform X2 [Ostrinia furnacalis]|uniref:uncharacterized protein LOC114350438 isoform X1 n=1 Tax=Ostrinia furnacalis TaxID=93504 RepID=UPI00103E39B1|nr:uncharacterized protein LOC114350438 isoform X1 [Ostrinia furnacalis]XP_028157053.1 uncharacterized protein LOC114350438 isoform X2 [Ostrinia furnacalis]